MPRLCCRCLNVQVHTKSDLMPFDRSVSDGQLAVSGGCCLDFFNQDLSQVSLSLEGISVTYPGLLRTRICSSWHVHQCVNCNMFTHATNVTQPRLSHILVYSQLISDESAIERLICSSDYSSLYKIVLTASTEPSSSPLSVDLLSKEVRTELELIQTQLNTFLMTEENLMEERIRNYEQTERESYSQLQTKARSDKNVLISRLLTVVSMSDSLSDRMHQSHVETITHQIQDTKRQLTSAAETARDDDDDDDEMMLTIRHESVSPADRTESHRQPLEPIDDVFQYDPGFQEDPNLPFSESDDDINDTDEGSLLDDIQRVSPESSSSSIERVGYSTSVPIDVPGAWMTAPIDLSHDHDDDNDDDLDSGPVDAEQMAASIQALARSVHGNSSEIFGELPRRATRTRVIRQSTSTLRH